MQVPREILAGLVSVALVFTTAGAFFAPSGADGPPGSDPPSPETLPPQSAAGQGPDLRVLLTGGQVETMALEDYIYGVLSAEMPASFEPAALEAQAVCARTYALRQTQAGKHAADGADVCADPGCCQAYAAQDPEGWGADAPALSKKLHAAVDATAGQVLRQDGGLINAVFHASSDGYTAPAQAVWGAAVPYLVSVSTPETADTVPRFESEATYTPGEFQGLFLSRYPAADLTGPPQGWFTGLERADWGGVERVTVGGVTLTGAQMRSLLGLRSTRFNVDSGSDSLTFHVTGYGHGVGMSQYGAQLMALDGAGYRDILAHYYPGTELEPM